MPGGGGGGLGDIIGIAAPIAGGVIGGSFGGPVGATIGAGIGGQIAGGFGAGQAQSEAQQRQQNFFQQLSTQRQQSPLAQRLFGLLGVQGGGGLQDLVARRDALQSELGRAGEGPFGELNIGRRGNREKQAELDSLNQQISGLEEAEAGFETTAEQITGARRRGVVAGGQASSQALESALGQSGAGGGLAARALAQQAGGLQRGLADVEAGEFQLIDALRQQEIANLSSVLGLTTVAPGFGAQQFGQGLGVPQPNFLTNIGGLGSLATQLGFAQQQGLFGSGVSGSTGTAAGQAGAVAGAAAAGF